MGRLILLLQPADLAVRRPLAPLELHPVKARLAVGLDGDEDAEKVYLGGERVSRYLSRRYGGC